MEVEIAFRDMCQKRPFLTHSAETLEGFSVMGAMAEYERNSPKNGRWRGWLQRERVAVKVAGRSS